MYHKVTVVVTQLIMIAYDKFCLYSLLKTKGRYKVTSVMVQEFTHIVHHKKHAEKAHK